MTGIFYPLLVVPFAGMIAYLYLYHTNVIFHLLVFSLPFSLTLRDIGLGVGLSIPSELLTAILGLLILTKIFYEYKDLQKLLWHPLSIAIYAHILWLVITTITSSMPIVSFKFVLVRVVYVLVYYLYSGYLFQKMKYVKSFIWLYTLGISIVIGIVFVKHWTLGLGQDTSNKISYPFYDDHTIYAACVVMMMPLVIALFYLQKKKDVLINFFAFVLFLVLVVGLLHSYSRAGWISIVGISVGWLMFRLKITFWQVMLLVGVLVGIGFYNSKSITDKLSKNDRDSGGSLVEHAQSASNISTDASNTERINRWLCAIRMGVDRPVLGYGPGTYMFNYGTFQKRDEMTIISVRDGSWGGSHSEYLKPFSESGYLGIITFLFFIFYGIKIGMDLLYKLEDKGLKTLLVAAILSFVSYLIHGFVNFFLDTDKSSYLFWAMLAIIAVLDIQYKQQKEIEKEEPKAE
ncbi:MAG: hypothetical protein GY827_02310 [Cytophagales bacterium]|nr:hypothetical protein [Cytophagales bacterium]